MRATLLLTTVLSSLLLSGAAPATEWTAKNYATLAIYGTPTSEEYEAFVNGTEECTPTGALDRKMVAVLYCGNNSPEPVLSANGGVTFRGKFYALTAR